MRLIKIIFLSLFLSVITHVAAACDETIHTHYNPYQTVDDYKAASRVVTVKVKKLNKQKKHMSIASSMFINRGYSAKTIEKLELTENAPTVEVSETEVLFEVLKSYKGDDLVGGNITITAVNNHINPCGYTSFMGDDIHSLSTNQVLTFFFKYGTAILIDPMRTPNEEDARKIMSQIVSGNYIDMNLNYNPQTTNNIEANFNKSPENTQPLILNGVSRTITN